MKKILVSAAFALLFAVSCSNNSSKPGGDTDSDSDSMTDDTDYDSEEQAQDDDNDNDSGIEDNLDFESGFIALESVD